MNAYDIIRKPVLTEKSYDGIPNKTYTFEVMLKATKTQIKNAIETIYPDVKVEKVNTMIVRGKVKRQGRFVGLTPKVKKAIVKLTAESKAISSFESMS